MWVWAWHLTHFKEGRWRFDDRINTGENPCVRLLQQLRLTDLSCDQEINEDVAFMKWIGWWNCCHWLTHHWKVLIWTSTAVWSRTAKINSTRSQRLLGTEGRRVRTQEAGKPHNKTMAGTSLAELPDSQLFGIAFRIIGPARTRCQTKSNDVTNRMRPFYDIHFPATYFYLFIPR